VTPCLAITGDVCPWRERSPVKGMWSADPLGGCQSRALIPSYEPGCLDTRHTAIIANQFQVDGCSGEQPSLRRVAATAEELLGERDAPVGTARPAGGSLL
jgi:hypothetical protein